MHSRCLVLLILVASTTVEALKLVITADTPSRYRVVAPNAAGDPVALFQGEEIAVFVGDTWCTAEHEIDGRNRTVNGGRGRLVLQNRSSISGTEPGLGPYTGEQFTWKCNVVDATATTTSSSIPIITSYKNTDSGNAVLMEVTWPQGASQTALPQPSMYKAAMTKYPSLATALPNALSWEGSFVQMVRGFSSGPAGGPTVFYNASDPTLSTVVVGSPWGGNWKSYTAGSDDDNNNDNKGERRWNPGISGRITSLPQGFRQAIVLYQRRQAGGGGGIAATLHEWGQAMQQSRPTRGNKLSDVTLEKIGYQTDNGAMYCFCQDRNCSNTLLEEIQSLAEQRIPMGYLSFQGAGASSGRGTAAPWCIDTWGIDGGLSKQYPMDLTTFQKALGIPLQLYAPYFCPQSPYFDENSPWTAVLSDASLPNCHGFAFENVEPSQSRAFYDWFLDKGHDRAGMASFESDFMNQNHNCVPAFITNATAADTWQQGMAGAALQRNVTIQWCYANPTDVLASLDMPAVTNFRVSFDFCYGESWKIGESSLLVWALGAAPSKDAFWTTDNNHTEVPGCSWTPDHDASAAELHVVLALMTTGPMGISDAKGNTNATLLRRTISQDGTILKPAKPLTSIDSTFLSVDEPAGNVEGYVYGTFGLGQSWQFVSFSLRKSYGVKLRDFWPHIEKPRVNIGREDRDADPILLAYRTFNDGQGCQNGADAVASGCVQLVAIRSLDEISTEVFQAPGAEKAPSSSPRLRKLNANRSYEALMYTPTVTTVWQPCTQSGFFFLGELGKYVPLSPARFGGVQCTKTAVKLAVKGTAGEVVELTALRRERSDSDVLRYTVLVERCHIPKGGVANLLLSDALSVNDDPFSSFVKQIS